MYPWGPIPDTLLPAVPHVVEVRHQLVAVTFKLGPTFVQAAPAAWNTKFSDMKACQESYLLAIVPIGQNS